MNAGTEHERRYIWPNGGCCGEHIHEGFMEWRRMQRLLDEAPVELVGEVVAA